MTLEEEQKVVRMYEEEGYTLRHLADIFKTDHHKIHRILLKNNVQITKRKTLKVFSEERKQAISKMNTGSVGYWRGKKATESMLRKKYDITIEDLEQYTDFNKLKFLTSGSSRNRKYYTKDEFLAFIDKFYNDAQFNKLYDFWLKSNKNKWYLPTLNHKHSRSRGGSWELENLQYLTWFENRAKAEMSQEEWELFRIETNTKSDLFS